MLEKTSVIVRHEEKFIPVLAYVLLTFDPIKTLFETSLLKHQDRCELLQQTIHCTVRVLKTTTADSTTCYFLPRILFNNGPIASYATVFK